MLGYGFASAETLRMSAAIARARRAEHLVQSEIRAMTQRCHELGGVNLGQGVCDTPPPPELLDAVAPALEHAAYSRYDGVDALRQALAKKLRSYNGLEADPESEIVVTVGTSGAFAACVTALCDPGDRVLLFEPYYGYHLQTAKLAGLDVDLVPLRSDFSVDLDVLEHAAQGARALVVNSPGNPTGQVLSDGELQAIAEICQRHDLLCISDEIYEYFLYDGRAHRSIATLPGMWERTVTLSGYSKTFSITGWRIGYLAAPQTLATAAGLVADLYCACAPTPLQHAVATAIETLDTGFYRQLASEYQAKRDQFCAVLEEIGFPIQRPQGAYYVLADISRLGCETSREAAQRVLEEAGVAGVAGSAFYGAGRGESQLRFCFGKRQRDLDRACDNLRRWAKG